MIRKLSAAAATIGLPLGTAATAGADDPTSVITLPDVTFPGAPTDGSASRPEGVATDGHDI